MYLSWFHAILPMTHLTSNSHPFVVLWGYGSPSFFQMNHLSLETTYPVFLWSRMCFNSRNSLLSGLHCWNMFSTTRFYTTSWPSLSENSTSFTLVSSKGLDLCLTIIFWLEYDLKWDTTDHWYPYPLGSKTCIPTLDLLLRHMCDILMQYYLILFGRLYLLHGLVFERNIYSLKLLTSTWVTDLPHFHTIYWSRWLNWSLNAVILYYFSSTSWEVVCDSNWNVACGDTLFSGNTHKDIAYPL